MNLRRTIIFAKDMKRMTSFYRDALGGLTATRAAIVQLAVPILAAVGGVLFLAEAISARLVLAAVMVLGGMALALNRSRTTTGS
jgi:drug/metabolite transporter (DMT)-like permease